MKTVRKGAAGQLAAAVVCVAIAAVGLTGCADSVSEVDRAEAQVTAKEGARTSFGSQSCRRVRKSASVVAIGPSRCRWWPKSLSKDFDKFLA